LSEEIIGNEEAEHRNHSAQHQPMMHICLSLTSLEPSNDKESSKQRGHQLA